MLNGFLRKLLKYLPSKGLPALSGLITLPIISRLFAPEIYGQYVVAETLVNFLVAATCSGLASSVLRFYLEYKKKSSLGRFFMALNANLAVFIGGTVAVVFLGLSLAKSYFSPFVHYMLLVAILVYVLRAVSDVYLHVPQARETPGVYTTFSLLTRYGSLGIGFALILGLGSSIDGLLWGQISTQLLVIPILVYLAIRGTQARMQGFSMEDSKLIFRWAWPLLIGNVAMWGLNLSDRYVVAYFRPDSELGFYSFAYAIADKSMNILVSVFILTVIPTIINTWETAGRQMAEESLTMVTRVYLIVALPAAIGLTVFRLPLLEVLATEPYYEGHKAVGYVAFASFFWGLAMFASMGLIIAKRTKCITANQLLAAGANLALNFAFVPRFGFVAAAMTTLVGFALLFGLQAYHSRDELTWRFPNRTLFRILISSAGMVTGLEGLKAFLGIDTQAWVLLLIGIPLGGVIYFAGLVILGEMKRAASNKASTTGEMW